jgi:hypothetical protein
LGSSVARIQVIYKCLSGGKMTELVIAVRIAKTRFGLQKIEVMFNQFGMVSITSVQPLSLHNFTW